MDILEKIENIRKKPEHIRRRYVWVMVLICGALIFLIWMFSLKNSFYINKTQDTSASKDEILKNLKESGKALNEIKNGVNELKEVGKSVENNSSEIANPVLENSNSSNLNQ